MSSGFAGSFFNYESVAVHEHGSEFEFLASRPQSDWAKILDHAETRRFSAGELIISAGASDRALYLLTEGTIGVRLPGVDERTFKAIDAPSVLGEVAFLDGGPRSATLYGMSAGELLRLRMESFEVLSARDPELGDGRSLPATAFLIAAGISPLVDLAHAAGIEVRRGVVVDDQLMSSAPGVYAIGDVAEHEGRVYGLWPAAVEQGEVAAENAVGGSRRYTGTIPVTMLKVVGVDLLSIGRFEPEEGDTVVILEDPEEHSYRKLVISDGKIVGAILIARQGDAPHVTAAAKDGRDVSGMIEELERGEWECLAADAPQMLTT